MTNERHTRPQELSKFNFSLTRGRVSVQGAPQFRRSASDAHVRAAPQPPGPGRLGQDGLQLLLHQHLHDLLLGADVGPQPLAGQLPQLPEGFPRTRRVLVAELPEALAKRLGAGPRDARPRGGFGLQRRVQSCGRAGELRGRGAHGVGVGTVAGSFLLLGRRRRGAPGGQAGLRRRHDYGSRRRHPLSRSYGLVVRLRGDRGGKWDGLKSRASAAPAGRGLRGGRGRAELTSTCAAPRRPEMGDYASLKSSLKRLSPEAAPTTSYVKFDRGKTLWYQDVSSSESSYSGSEEHLEHKRKDEKEEDTTDLESESESQSESEVYSKWEWEEEGEEEDDRITATTLGRRGLQVTCAC